MAEIRSGAEQYRRYLSELYLALFRRAHAGEVIFDDRSGAERALRELLSSENIDSEELVRLCAQLPSVGDVNLLQ